MKNLFITMAIAVCLMAACNPSSQPTADQSKVDTLTYETISMMQSVNGCNPDSQKCTYIAFNYPQLHSGPEKVIDSMNTLIIRFLNEDENLRPADSVQYNFISDYNDFTKKEKGYSIPWYINKNVAILNQNKRWITLSLVDERFTGGAHPNSITSYLLLDRNTGERMDLYDFFDSTAVLKLTALGEPVFCADKKIAPNQSLADAGYTFPDNHFTLSSNFYFTEDGIIFFYNAYEIAPYVNGSTSITIPASSILGLMKHENK